MKFKVLDKSNYLKGLLVLISKDNKVSEHERNFLLEVGKSLGFDKEFCEEAIETLLENEYISQEPPVFSKKEFAESFLRDGINLAVSDLEVDKNEINYLKAIAEVNKIDEDWFYTELNNCEEKVLHYLNHDPITLEASKHI